jgi:hypothetical protein
VAGAGEAASCGVPDQTITAAYGGEANTVTGEGEVDTPDGQTVVYEAKMWAEGGRILAQVKLDMKGAPLAPTCTFDLTVVEGSVLGVAAADGGDKKGGGGKGKGMPGWAIGVVCAGESLLRARGGEGRACGVGRLF